MTSHETSKMFKMEELDGDEGLETSDYNSDERSAPMAPLELAPPPGSSITPTVASSSQRASSSKEEIACHVCGDSATGRHYGAVTCNGCKGFFRRTVRRGYKYSCRFNGNCNIDKLNRAICRYCRYIRCVNAGMKEDAVQSERDIIGKRHHSNSVGSCGASTVGGGASSAQPLTPSANPLSNSSYNLTFSPPSTPSYSNSPSTTTTNNNVNGNSMKRRQSLESEHRPDTRSKRGSPPETGTNEIELWDTIQGLLDSLLRSESSIQSLRDTVIRQMESVEYSTKPEEPKVDISGGRAATVNDIFTSIHSQLLLVIEWAKTLPPFAALSTQDQTALLRHFAAQQLVLCVAYRSINAANTLKLINDSYIPRMTQKGDNMDFYARDCERVLDELVAPMRFLKIDETEFVAMKACILFNPVARGLSSSTVMSVLATRRKIFAALEAHCRRSRPEDPTRMGDLTFFILSPLQSLANCVSDDVLVSKLSGAARIDLLMEELILSDAEEQKFMLPLRSSDGSSTGPPSNDDQQQHQHVHPSSSSTNHNHLHHSNDHDQSNLLHDDLNGPSTSYATMNSIHAQRSCSISSQDIAEVDLFGNEGMTPLSSYIFGTLDPFPLGGSLDDEPSYYDDHHSHFLDNSPPSWASPVLSAIDPPPYNLGGF